VGAGNIEDVVLRCTEADPLELHAAEATVRNLTVHRRARRGQDGAAVVVPRGTLTLEDCDLLGECPAALVVQGQGSAVRLLRCNVRGGTEAGVQVRDRARASLEDCEVLDVRGTG